MSERTYRKYTYRDANFSICCDEFDAVTAEIVRQRTVLEAYIADHPEFAEALEPLGVTDEMPDVAKRMAEAAKAVGVGPMAAVAGVMAQLAVEAGMSAGASEAIAENGGDIYIAAENSVTVRLHAGQGSVASSLAFLIEAEDTPLAICSSSGKMGRSMSLGDCDLAAVVARDAGIADAAATRAANLVRSKEDIESALNTINAIKGVDGVLIVKDDAVGLQGNLPNLIKGNNL